MFNPAVPMSWFTPSAAPSQSELGQPGDPMFTTNGSSSTRPRFVSTAGGPVTLPSDWSDDDAASWVKAYDEYIDKLTKAWQQSSGLQRRQIEAQIADAKKGREVQWKIAQLQADTSRYGTDVQKETELARLKENARQFDLTHGLEMQKLGLNRAQTATEYLSTPDRFVQASDFLNLSGRVLAGQPGVGTGSGETPQMKTMADFDALTAGGNPGRQVDPVQAAAGGAPNGGGGGSNAGSDARVKALRALVDAAPPSDDPGIDNNGYQVLQAAKAIYGMNLTPQQQAALRADDQSFKMLGSAGSRLGYDPAAWWQRQQRSLPGQQSVRSA